MTQHKSRMLILLHLLLFVLCASGQALATPGICLFRTPAPPNAALNDGTGSVTFNWTTEYLTTCNQPYKLDILNPAGAIIQTQNFPCAPSIIANNYNWPVPAGATPGCYYGRLTFFSNWCSGDPNKFEDLAQTGFLVSPAGRFRICKFHDLNGNGKEDPGEPRLSGWQFTVEQPLNNVIAMVTTGPDGCTPYVTVPLGQNGTGTVWVRETQKQGWVQTTPATNPVQVNLVSGNNADVVFGNYQAIFITGYKLLDQAPWPWISPKYVGPDGQQNPAAFEPVPPCPQPAPPNACISPFQPGQVGIGGVTIQLFKADGVTLITSTVTSIDGSFSFGPLQYEQEFVIKELNPAADPPDCNTNATDFGLINWPGAYESTVATSPWPCRIVNFTTPDELAITIPAPVVVNQAYGCNFFWNHQPARLWGNFCPTTTQEIPQPQLTVVITEKDGEPWPGAAAQANANLTYQVPALQQAPGGLRPGTYTLTIPQAPTDCQWQVTTFCENGTPEQSTLLAAGVNKVDVEVGSGQDVRVDFCLECPPNERRCFLPVTFTAAGWSAYCDQNSPLIPGGMIYNRFPIAFANFVYNKKSEPGRLIVGGQNTITFIAKTASLQRLCMLLGGTCQGCGPLKMSLDSPWRLTTAEGGGCLAVETITLLMNIAYNDMRLMPRTAGYDLEDFTVAQGPLKGKTVGQVWNIANAVLSGDPPQKYGLLSCDALVEVLRNINANYEFVDFNTFIDRGYLIPNRALGKSDPPHPPVVPF